jgi:MOSC domain-containing protein YiiM
MPSRAFLNRFAERCGRSRVGDCRLLIKGETRPCERMEEAWPGLWRALAPPWRAGAYAEVLDDGDIAIGAAVEWSDARAQHPG